MGFITKGASGSVILVIVSSYDEVSLAKLVPYSVHFSFILLRSLGLHFRKLQISRKQVGKLGPLSAAKSSESTLHQHIAMMMKRRKVK